jgi:hypothetical protein
LKPELSIKLDYLQDRKNPAEIFDAMSLYINAYRDFGQLMTNSIGIKGDFDFQLNAIESGSILSKLSSLPGKLDAIFEAAFYKSGNSTFEELISIDETETEQQVEELALNIENSLASNIPNQIADPHIDRQNLAHVLKAFSFANEKIKSGESVIFKSSNDSQKECRLNTSWRFTGNPKEMFQGSTESHDSKLKLIAKISVNEGNSVWTFRCERIKQPFSARIIHKEWLEKYQRGLIQPVGPKDIMDAHVSYDIYTPPKGKGEPVIRNAKIKEITEIKRNTVYQHELSSF